MNLTKVDRVLVALAEDKGDSSSLAFHLSAASHFAFLEIDKNQKKILTKEIKPSGIKEATTLPAKYVATLGYNIIITRAIGPPALAPFAQAGIQVLTGTASTLSEAIKGFMEDKLEMLGVDHQRLKHTHELMR